MKEWGFFIKKHIFDLFMQMICNHKICTSNVSYHDFFTSRWCVFTSRWWLFKKPCCTRISIYNFHLDCVCVIIIWCKLWCNHNLRKSFNKSVISNHRKTVSFVILRILINFYCGLVLSVIIIISSERGMKGSTLKTSLKAFYFLNMMSSKNKIKDKLLEISVQCFWRTIWRCYSWLSLSRTRKGPANLFEIERVRDRERKIGYILHKGTETLVRDRERFGIEGVWDRESQLYQIIWLEW